MIYKFSAPSLFQLASVQVGSILLNQMLSDKHCYREEVLPRELEKWSKVKDKLSEIIKVVRLPKVLKLHVWDVVYSLYHQTWNWVDFCNSCSKICDPAYTCNLLFHELYFTGRGQIDRTKTLRAHIEWLAQECRRLGCDICRVFIKACNLCLEDCIRNIWKEMSESERQQIIQDRLNSRATLLAYWVAYIQPVSRKVSLMKFRYNPGLSKDENNFCYAFGTADKMTVEYFWNCLSGEEKKRRAKLCADFALVHRIPDLLCNALNYLDEEDYLLFIQHFPFEVLKLLLGSTYFEFFMLTLEKLWPVLDVRKYVRLLVMIVELLPMTCEGSRILLEILEEFWLSTPSRFKWQIFGDFEASSLLTKKMSVFCKTNKANVDAVYRILCKGSTNIDWRHIMAYGR